LIYYAAFRWDGHGAPERVPFDELPDDDNDPEGEDPTMRDLPLEVGLPFALGELRLSGAAVALTPADRGALQLLAAAAEAPLPEPWTDTEAHLRRALRWLGLLEPTEDGRDALTRRACQRLEALAGLLLEDLGAAIRQTTTRADAGPAPPSA
jgi:hypothetical protein